MHELGVNIPNKTFADPRDVILTQLALTPARDLFATLSIDGKFNISEATLSYIQKHISRFHLYKLLYQSEKLQIKDIVFNDLSPTDAIFSNKNTPIWQTFLRKFDTILQKYELSQSTTDNTDVGDLTFFVGWTHNYEKTKSADFIDFTLRLGLLFPTGKTKDEDEIFSLPFGYNGHWGIPITTDIAFGLYEWLTIGAHLHSMFFINKTGTIRMKNETTSAWSYKTSKRNNRN